MMLSVDPILNIGYKSKDNSNLRWNKLITL